MKDHSAASHSLVAQNRKSQAAATQEDSGGGISDYNLHCDSSFSDDNDWESGKLVIDLDVDTNKSPQKTVQGTPKKSAVVALSRSPAKKSVSNMEHMQATVDKGLKMKIKRKNAGAKSDKSHEIVRNDPRASTHMDSTSLGHSPTVSLEKMKTGCEKDKVPKGRANQKEKKGKERLAKQSSEPGVSNTSGPSVSGVGSSHHGASSSDTKSSQSDSAKGNTPSAPDPYEFNAKVEDRIGLPHVKKMKIEKVEVPPVSACSKSPGGEHRDMGVETCSQYVMTDPDCLGPCEPGTSVTLEGIVWQETENGMLVVNVTWRGKTFVGTLLDATKHDWAPPRLSCDSPTAEIETRTPKGRGKRGRGAAQAPLHDVSNTDRRNLRKGRRRNSGATTSTFTAPPSPAKVEVGTKRKGRPTDLDLESAKRSRSGSSTRSSPSSTQDDSPQLIECPEPNCSKKYRHINGLRYHQSHAHQNSVIGIDDNGQVIKEEKMDTSPSVSEKPAKNSGKDKEETKVKVEVEKEPPAKEPPKGKSEKGTKGKGKKSLKQDKESKESKESKTAKAAEEANSNNTQNSKSGAQAKGASTDGKATSQDNKKAAPQGETKAKSSAPQGESKSKGESSKPESTSDAKQAPEKDTVPSEAKSSSDSNQAAESAPSPPETKSSPSTVISTCNTVTSVSKNLGVTYQITGPTIGCVGGITVVSGSGQTVGTTMGTITAKVGGGPLGMRTNIATMSGMPVATVVTATTVDIPKADDKVKKPKPEKQEKTKAKGTTANRPIVPAPMTVAQGGLATVTTHAQVSPISSTASTLKPIQPKPTIMGEPTNIPPALTSLKEKKSKKKKKDREVKEAKVELPKDLSKGSVSSVLPLTMHKQTKDTHPKAESTSVIKAAPSASLGTPSRLGAELGKVETDRNIPAARSLLTPVKDRPEGPPQLQHQLQGKTPLATPGSLDIKTAVAQSVPVPVVEDGGDRENSSDVHSPAYSDISDANDSAPTLESENDKVETPGQPETVVDKNQKQDMSRGYGQMYPYYSQPPYLVPAVQPSSSKPGECTPSAMKNTPKKPESSSELKTAPSQKEVDLRDQSREKEQPSSASPVAPKQGPPVPTTPQSQSDYQTQHSRLQQQIYHQLHYVYKMPPDQAYHMTLIQSDPQYRAQYMKDQQSRAEKADGEKGGEKKREVSETVSRPPPEPQNLQQRPRDSPAAKGSEAKPDNKPPALIPDRDRADKERMMREREVEQNLKEKQHENHQILKENIELKAQMERPTRYDPVYVRHQEDIQRYQLFCQQQKLQQQRGDDAKPIDARKQPIASRSSTPEALVVPKDKPHSDIRQDLAMRTRSPSTGPQGPKDLSSPKTGLDKNRADDKLLSASPRTTPKPKEGAIPTSSSLPPGGQASYAQYMAHPYYASQVPYEAGPVYRGPVMGYPGATYLHAPHTQALRYMSPNEQGIEKEKATVSPNPAPQPEAPSKEPVQAHGPHFYSQGNTPHKIHELKDVGKGDHASPGKPAPEGDRQASPFTKQGEQGGSPPTQRHLHSHHHTHVVTPGYPIYDPYTGFR